MKKIDMHKLFETDGFTLIEAMISLAVLSAILLGIAVMMDRSILQNGKAAHTTEATMHGVDTIEHLMTLDPSDTALTTGSTTTTDNYIISYKKVSDDADDDSFMEFLVTVKWNEGATVHEVEMNCMRVF